MELLIFFLVWFPLLCLATGIAMLTAGFLLKKKRRVKGLLIAGGICVGLCLLGVVFLFLVGAVGIGPVPN